jgi:DNA replication protein DnaC
MESMGTILAKIKQKAQESKAGSHLSLVPDKKTCKCGGGNGVIHTLKWVEYPDYLDREGNPMKEQIATLEYCSCRLEKIFEKNNATAGMKDSEKAHTFETALIDSENETHYRTASEFIRNLENHREVGSWLYIFGDEQRAREKGLDAYGTGKSFLMQCIGNALTKRSIPAIYVTEDKLFQDIKDTYDRESAESESDVLNRYFNVPILLIDDLFSAQYKEWADSKLYSILNTRKGDNKITIITTNYAPNRIRERLPINGAKIASRIMEESILIEMIGKDRRIKEGVRKSDKRREWSH